MARRGRTSTTKQIEQAVNAINRIGYSKRAEKLKNSSKKSDYLHSYKAVKETLNVANNFANYAKEHFKIKSIYELSQTHYRSYLEHLEQKGVSKGYLLNIETYLRKLEFGMSQISKEMGRESVKFTTERLYHSYDREKARDRSYSRSEIEKLSKHMSHNVREAMLISVNAGLREREIENLRVEHIKEREGRLYIVFDQKNAKGVTKAGRPREIEVKESYADRLRALAQNKEPHERLIKIKTSTMRDGLSRAAKKANVQNKGFHGFRHTYARERVNELLPSRHLLDQVRKNIEAGRRVDNGLTRSEFAQVKEVIDKVHAALGHGNGRWDLFSVYMK